MATRDIYQSTFNEDVPTTSATQQTCPECDGRVRTNALETACTECELLITEQALDHGSGSAQYETEHRRTGAPRTVARHDRGLSTRIGRHHDGKGWALSGRKRKQLSRLRREHGRASVRSKRERNERHGITEIRRLAGALELCESLRDRACSLFQRAQDENLLVGRSVESMAAASVYAACRVAGLPQSVDEVALHTAYSVAELRRRFAVLNVELALSVPPLTTRDYVPRFASDLGVAVDVRHRALELAAVADREGLANGPAPNGVAGGCLYVASQERGESVTQGIVGSVAGVSNATIRARKNEVLGIAGE